MKKKYSIIPKKNVIFLSILNYTRKNRLKKDRFISAISFKIQIKNLNDKLIHEYYFCFPYTYAYKKVVLLNDFELQVFVILRLLIIIHTSIANNFQLKILKYSICDNNSFLTV